jgi:hypothetical protein
MTHGESNIKKIKDGQFIVCYEHNSGILSSVRDEEFISQLSDCLIIKKFSEERRYLYYIKFEVAV